MKNNIILFVLAVIMAAGCKEPFDMELHATHKAQLVVEGFLNRGAVSTFHLSRTIKLTDNTHLKPELAAQVSVEGKDNSIASFAERGNGVYEAILSHLQVGNEYRLRIKTTNGKEYLSDYVTVKNTPPIDSISYRQEDGGVRIFASAHDASDQSRYYRWDFEETWEIRSNYNSYYKVRNGRVVERDMSTEDVSTCWKFSRSSNIILGSSARLSSDVIKESPLQFIPRADEKLGHRYSILVRQYVLSKEAYEYFQLMKKNTESLGSIFDPQPSEITGNIHCVSDPNEPVIGFVTASSVQEKRLFIAARELGGRGYTLMCEELEVPNHPDSILAYFTNTYQPYEANYSRINPSIIVSYFASNDFCVDCTIRGGTTTKPSFW